MASAANQRRAAQANAGRMLEQQYTRRMMGEELRDSTTRGIAEGYQAGIGALQGGASEAQGYLDQSLTPFQGLFDTAQQGAGLYADAVGLNGQEGSARAQEAFRTSPGYEWQVNQATDAALRKAGAAGIAGSGNTLAALTTLGQGLADQEYGSWLDRLNQYNTQATTLAGSMSNVFTNKANVANTAGQNIAGLQVGKGTSEADNIFRYWGLTSDDWANTDKAIAQQYTNAAEASDAAKNANQNALLGAAGTALNLLKLPMGGGGSIGGSIFSSLLGK